MYSPQRAFWCVVHSRTPFHFRVMADEEEERKKNKHWSDFATPTKVSETLGVVLHLNSEGLLVPRP